MGRGATFHRRRLVDEARPGTAPAVTTSAPTDIGAYEFPPFMPPELQSVRGAAWAMLTARVLMVAWAIVTAVRIEQAGDDPLAQSPSGTVTALGWLLVAAWFAAASRWSWLRTVNVHQLDGRYPTRTRAAVVWSYPAVWVVLMGVTLIPAAPNPEFDYRPPIIVAGFLLTMLSGYRIIHRIFKSLVRMPPTATCVAFYVVDTAAFGLIWWRTTSWTGRDGIAPLDRDLDLGILAAATVALTVGAVVTWYLDRSANRSQEIRLLALRTRYDHRMARLNGLDPMNPGTRYALMLARRAAERAARRPIDDRTKDTVADDDPLLAELAKELEHGITPQFAARVRALEQRTGSDVPTRITPPADSSPGAALDQPDVAAAEAPVRLWLAELMRYLVVACYVVCAVASVALVVAYQADDRDNVELIRHVLIGGATGVHVLVCLWALRIALDARRFGLPLLWRLPFGALAASSVLLALWFGTGAEGDAASIGLFTVLTLGIELALWRITQLDWMVVYRESDSPLEAWMSVAPFVLGLTLLSPMRFELTADVSIGRVGLFAALIGLAAAIAAGLSAVAMVQLEDALRATTPGDRNEAPAEPAPAPPPVVVPTMPLVQTPTPKPRSTAPQPPLRVDVGDVPPEVAAGLGFQATASERVSDQSAADAVERVAAEAVERVAAEAVGRVAAEAVERAGAEAVERVAAEAVERAAAEAVGRVAAEAVERAATQAAERAATEAAERAATEAAERAATEAAERAAVEAAERAAADVAKRAARGGRRASQGAAAAAPAEGRAPAERSVDDTAERDDQGAAEVTTTPRRRRTSEAGAGGSTRRRSADDTTAPTKRGAATRDGAATSRAKSGGARSGRTTDPAERAAQLEQTVVERLAAEGGPDVRRPRRSADERSPDHALDRVVARFTGDDADQPSESGAFALDADADHGGGHQDPAEARDEREVAGDEVGRLREDVDDADHGQQDHDVAEPGDGADESAGPGER